MTLEINLFTVHTHRHTFEEENSQLGVSKTSES